MPRPLRRTCSAQGAVRESRRTQVTSLGLRAMSSVVVALFFSISLCAVAESADAQPRALAAAAAALRVPMLCTTPLFLGTARLVSFPDHLVNRRRPPLVRKMPDGPETRPDGWFGRTKGGGRPSHVLCGPAGPILAEIQQPIAPRDPRTLVVVQCRARYPTRFRTNTFHKLINATSHMDERGRQLFRKINYSGQFLIRG